MGADGRIYLRLADGRGWAFDDSTLFPWRSRVVKFAPTTTGDALGFSWDFHGIFMGLSWDFHGILMGFSWDFNGIVMGFSWDFNGIFMGF